LIRAIDAIARPLVLFSNLRGRSRSDESNEVRSILVQEYWNLGDIVMELPFLRNLRARYPKARIVLLTGPKTAPLVESQDLVDEIIVVRAPWAEHYSRWRKYNPFSSLWIELALTLKRLRARSFDLAFSARADLRENFILWLLSVRRRVGYSFGGGGVFLTDVVTPDPEHPHFSERWLRLLEHLGEPIRWREPRFHLTEEEEGFADAFLAQRGIGKEDFLVGVHAGARSPVRQWGEANFGAVAERLRTQFPIKILWFQDPNQKPSLRNGNDFARLSLPLRQFMAVLSRCRLLICNDSGPMHIATALKVPVVAVFGPTEPAWFGPLGQGNTLVIRPGFWCRPCFDYCLFDKPYCLRTISVESVYHASASAVASLISKAGQVPSTNGPGFRVEASLGICPQEVPGT
jgi:ADP-heptose:LPS heptosyltransferase